MPEHRNTALIEDILIMALFSFLSSKPGSSILENVRGVLTFNVNEVSHCFGLTSFSKGSILATPALFTIIPKSILSLFRVARSCFERDSNYYCFPKSALKGKILILGFMTESSPTRFSIFY